MIASRRGFITGLAALIAAPAVVKAASLMPVRAIIPINRLPEYIGPLTAQLDVAYGVLKVGDVCRIRLPMDYKVTDFLPPVEDYKEFLITGTNTVVALPNRQ